MTSKDTGRKYESKSTSSYSQGTNTALTAVALQDHLIRNLSLRDPFLVNRHRVPVHKPRQWKKEVKATIDTGRGNLRSKKKQIVQKEYVLDPKPPAPTLAQRMGLVDAPAQPLTEDEWRSAKEKSNRRDDSKQPCVICKEEFGTQEQVLLSCTHVFHRACLQAFERFTGRKTCPMCRKEQYQTRVIHEGARVHRHVSATKIQAAWRGYVVRCWYIKLRETNPPKDPGLRKKFYQQKLSSITDRMIRSLDSDVGGFLREIDANIQASRDIMRQFEDATKQISDEQWELIQIKAIERGDKDCPICLTLLEEDSLIDETSLAAAATSGSPGFFITETVSDGSTSRSQGNKSYQKDAKLEHTKHLHQLNTTASRGNKPHGKTSSGSSSPAKKPANYSTSAKIVHDSIPGQNAVPSRCTRRRSVLLSCSHVFHCACVETFEEFSLEQTRHLCPVCRTQYQKKVL